MKVYPVKLFLLVAAILFLFSSVVAQSNADSLIKELKKPHTDSMRVSILLNLSYERLISKDSTLLFAREAVVIAEKTHYPRLISMSLSNLCNWYFTYTDNFDTILFHCRNHYKRVSEINFTSGMAQACGNLGRAYLWNSLDSAMYYDLKSVELYNEAKKFEFANIAKTNLANVYIEMKRFSEAIAILKETAAYSIKTGNKENADLSYLNMGACYIRIGDLTNAEKYIKQGQPSGDAPPYDIGYCTSQLADVYCAQGRYDEAYTLYSKVIESGKANQLDFLLYLGYNGLAELSFKKSKWTDAIRYKKLCWNYSYKDRDTEESMYEMIYKCDSAMGNYKDAMLGFQKFIAVRDSYENHARLKSADALEAKYQNKEKQSQINLLDKEKKLQTAEIEKQQLMRNLIIFSVFVLLGAGALFFNRFKLKKKIESQQALLNERKRISSELHDDLGAQLSTARMFLNNLRNNADANGNSMLIENSLNLIDSSISDLRKIMDDLQTSTLQEKGYVAATEELVNKINHLQQINFTLTHHDVDKRFESKTEHNLFRITQELINNTLKYAKAKNVLIDLVKRDNKIVLMYEDDGMGFDLQNVKRGYGLSNIESRIKSLEGIVEFDSTPGKGFRTVLEIPLIYAGEKV